MNSLTVAGYLSMKSFRNAKLSMIRSGYSLEETRIFPSARALALLSHGSHVTATSTCPATKAAPASPDFMFCSFTSARDKPFFWRTWARNHSDTEPWLTATRSEEHTSELQ